MELIDTFVYIFIDDVIIRWKEKCFVTDEHTLNYKIENTSNARD